MLYASMEVISAAIQHARSMLGSRRDISAPLADAIRNVIGKQGFAHLWEKMGILDPEIAAPFLELEAAIDRMRAETGPTTVQALTERLDHLSVLVDRICDLAGGEIKRTVEMASGDEQS
jgi:hypothetical protein